MIGDKERRGKIKTFLAERKPEPVKVFQFTEDMLPEINCYNTYQPIIKCDFCPAIFFRICGYITICCIRGCKKQNKYNYGNFEVGDYIAKQGEGDYFVIKKEEFKKNWVGK